MQMAFKSERHGSERVFNAHHRMPVPERCFKSTSNYYGTFRPAGSTGPMERFSHNKPCGRNDGIFEADFCSRCGIDGNGLDCMHYCWSCWERGTEVVSHLSCIDRNELLWLLGNEDERHWRCKECRSVSQAILAHVSKAQDVALLLLLLLSRKSHALCFCELAAHLLEREACEHLFLYHDPSVLHQHVFAVFRQKGLRPQSGQVYEDAATDLTAQTVAAAATASACAVAPSIAASGLSQAPAAASSGRPKRRRRQTQFFDNSHAAKPDAESSDSNDNSSNDRNYSATHSRCKQHCTSRQARGSRKHGQRITQELWPICKDECTQRCGVHTGDSQWASASGQPTSATQQVAGGQAVQDWLDDASSDDEPKHAVHMPSAVIGRVNAEQVVHKSDEDGDEEGEAAAPGGSLSTAYDTDADFDDDDDDAPAPAAPLRVMSGPTPTALNQHQSVASQGISLQLSSQACSKRAEPAALPPSVEAAAAVAPMPPVMVPRAVKSAESPGNAESPGDAEPSSMIKTAGQPSCGLLSSSTQDMPSASAPQPTTVAELVAAVNAAMPNSEDAIKLKQMEVFSRLKDLVKLEDDQTHHAVDDLQDLAELTHYQALKIRQHYLRLKPPYK